VEGELGRGGRAAEEADAVLDAADEPGSLQRFRVDRLRRVQPARPDRRGDAVEPDFGEVLAENVGEAALRQAPMQRHLAALEAVDGDAGTRGLALAAATAGLAHARADAATDALALLRGAGIVGKFVQFHGVIPVPMT